MSGGEDFGRRLQDRVMFITGAASGIGTAIARRCAAEGAMVACADRDGEGADRLADALGSHALPLPCDVTDPDSIGDAVRHAHAHFRRLDGLVHNRPHRPTR